MNSADMSDFKLISRILDGQKELYRVLMERHAAMVFHVVQKYETDHDRISEMAHEIFLKAYEQLNSFRNRSAFSSWLYRLSQNHCIDHSRRKKIRNTLFTELPDDHALALQTREPNPDNEIESDEQSKHLREALNKISKNNAIPLLMKYRDGMSYEAISKALNVPEGALKVRVHRARKELKLLMEQLL